MPIIRDILYGAAHSGANLPAMCRQLEITVADLSRSDRVVDFEQAYKAWEVALAATGDTALGLHLGATTTPSILGIVGHLMQSCATLSDAFRQVCIYSAVATDMFKYSMTQRDQQTILTFSPAPAWTRISPKTARQAVDQAMAGCLNVFFLLSGQHIRPLNATFAFRSPAQLDPYTQAFGTTLQFNARYHSLIFLRHDLQVPLYQHDRSLFATFEALAKKQLRIRRSKSTFRDEVLSCMRFEFAPQVPSLEIMAARMNLSSRTFQRKLAAESMSYRDMADQASKEIAMSLLSSGNISLKDMARLMGYSEPSALRRAIKRWTNSTPRKWKLFRLRVLR
ncbi:MAG TPA: AraC family transcriptional regulator ligand-binding domain-containing protein [Chryseolinea sp.]|nr:AraC family transcriptional regulator ligand-binding domain-containing protein [Chryseolinea sp.]